MSAPLRAGRYDVIAGLAVLVGLLLLAENFGLIGHVGQGWPLAVTLTGTGLVVAGIGRRGFGRGLVGVGVFLLLTSALFLYLNFTTWSLMADLWPLFIGFLGVAMFVSGTGKRGLLAYVSLFLVLLSLVFFLVFSVDPKLWPLSLVIFGLTLLLLGREHHEQTGSDH